MHTMIHHIRMKHLQAIQEFSSNLKKGKPLIGIDHGFRKVGISVSDPRKVIAMPYKTLSNSSSLSCINEIKSIVQEKNACGIVIGYPVDMSGFAGESCDRVKSFVTKLAKILKDIPYFFQDERFSTKSALRSLENTKMKFWQKNQVDDRIAAAHILQTTLDMLNKK